MSQLVPSRRSRPARRLLVAGATVAAASLALAAPAGAHVGPDKSEVAAGSFVEVAMGVPHGCDGSPTTKIEIQIPKELTDVTPLVVPGWKGSVTTEKLDPPVKAEDGDEITERDATVTWTADPGNELADHWKLSFGLSFQVPDEVGKALVFPTIQTCQQGTSEWIEPTVEGEDEPEHPAPTVMIVAGTGEGGHGDSGSGEATTTTVAGASDDGGSASGSDDSSKDDGSDDSSKGLAVAGLVAGLAGLGAGGAAFAKTRKA
jgi:uncharacterized protein YcnI